MQVTEVRLMKADPTDSCKAYGSITLDGDFVVCGIRVLEKKDTGQLFVGFPSKQNSKGEYKDVCVYCILKIPTSAEGNPKSCMRNFPIIADAFGISLSPQ